MLERTKRLYKICRGTITHFVRDDCWSMAAALAYYAVLSLPPLLVIVILVAGFLYDAEAAKGELRDQIRFLIGGEGAAQVDVVMRNAVRVGEDGSLAWIVGIGALLFGSTIAFAQLQYALNRTWKVEPDPERGGVRNFLVKRLFSFGMVLTIAFLLLVSLAISAALTAFGTRITGLLPAGVSDYFLRGLNLGISLVAVTILFAAMLKVLPDARVAWRDVWVGAVFTAILFAIGKYLIGLYLGTSDLASTYGAAGSLVIILVWVYYSSVILLLGSEFTQSWARHHGREILPQERAVRVIEERKRIPELRSEKGARTPASETKS